MLILFVCFVVFFLFLKLGIGGLCGRMHRLPGQSELNLL